MDSHFVPHQKAFYHGVEKSDPVLLSLSLIIIHQSPGGVKILPWHFWHPRKVSWGERSFSTVLLHAPDEQVFCVNAVRNCSKR